MSGPLTDPHNSSKKLTNPFRIRRSVPPELEAEFVTYKDIAGIDRIHASAWIGLALTLCMFGLDFFRMSTGEFYTNPYFPVLYKFHLVGLLFVVPAVFLTKRKAWVKSTRLRRGIVIWGMVCLVITFLLGQAVLVFLDRDSLVLFLGYIFVFTWMFAMSERERMLFSVGSILVMSLVIFYVKEDITFSRRISYFLEILFLTLTALIFDAFDSNLNLKNFLARREIEREQERVKQLEEFKSRFFTNLTHELRTPLTMIAGMAKEIADNPQKWAAEGSEIISRNAGNLLNLVNQILTLSKIESGNLSVHLIRGDMVSYLGYIVDAFRGFALLKRIKMHFLSEEDQMDVSYDPEKLLMMLSNLLSNAIKFTPEEGNIYVHLGRRHKDDRSWVEIQVRDTGVGIPQGEMEHVFERFYQASNEYADSGIGTGIGLSLVHELVKLLGGEIQVKSVVQKGTTFTLLLPEQEAIAAELPSWRKEEIRSSIYTFLPPVPIDELAVSTSNGDGRPEILVVEDNSDVARYLQVCLAEGYNLTFLGDGAAALDKAIEMVPDLILSDVLMPVKDGLELCRDLKANAVTNHIPIILLSAKADIESRIEGLRNGADVYLVKPFEKAELLMHIRNLLESRMQLQEKFQSGTNGSVGKDDPGSSTDEDPFIVNARKAVLDNLDDTELSVTQLCRAVYLSRTQLHKKLKALTGMSATHFIRHIRLSRGRTLVEQTSLPIAEIAYSVGFADPNYFSRCYGEEFGESPSETRNRLNSSSL